uniref:Sm domain-containing protein n=1 Tax=Ursus maritimus TaxID=29073 RepID=A0A452TH08_URSMA
MSKGHPTKLEKLMDKKLSPKLNGGRHVQRILQGFDPFVNLVIDECVKMATSGQQNNIRMVTSSCQNSYVLYSSPMFLRGENGSLSFKIDFLSLL